VSEVAQQAIRPLMGETQRYLDRGFELFDRHLLSTTSSRTLPPAARRGNDVVERPDPFKAKGLFFATYSSF
jgi:hypothetical protein